MSRIRKRKSRIRKRKPRDRLGEETKKKKLSKRKLRPKRSELGDMSGGEDGFYMTLDEIAQELGISKERVRQDIYSALGKIKREFPELEEWLK